MPSSSSRSATRSTTVCVSCTSSATRRSGCCCWNSQSSSGTTTAAGPVEAPIESSPGQRPGALGGDLVEHLLLELEQALRAAEQPQPGLGRLDAAPGAVEQLHPEPLLERPHLQRDGGLGDAESLGRLREAAPLDDGAERGELTRIHKRSLSQVRDCHDLDNDRPGGRGRGRRPCDTIRSAHEGLDRHDELAARAVLPAADRAARGAGSRGARLGARLRADARAARRRGHRARGRRPAPRRRRSRREDPRDGLAPAGAARTGPGRSGSTSRSRTPRTSCRSRPARSGCRRRTRTTTSSRAPSTRSAPARRPASSSRRRSRRIGSTGSARRPRRCAATRA